MAVELEDVERVASIELLTETIEHDRFSLSPPIQKSLSR